MTMTPDRSPGAVGRDPAAVLASLPDPVLVIDGGAQIRYANLAAQQVLGYSVEEWIGRSMLELIHPDDVPVVLSSMGTVQGKQAGTPLEVRVREAGGSWRWLEVVGGDRLDVDGVEGLVCVARDITDRRIWEVARGDVERFQQVVQHASAITLLLDRDGVVTSVNGAFTRLLGHDPSLVIGHRLAEFAVPRWADGLDAVIREVAATARTTSTEVVMHSVLLGQDDRPVRFELVNLLDDPVVSGIVVSGHDVSELQVARRELEHLASHDALTGLANRALLLECLQANVDARHPMAVLYVDLDRFKPVNDLFGHEAGDELLREVGDRLLATVRPRDLVARVGGDEFVVVADGLTSREFTVALCRRVEVALSEPYMLGPGPVRIGASVGFALSDEMSTVTGLLADADLHMYDVKADKRGETPRAPAERRRSADQRRRLAEELAAGVHRGELVAFLQPIIDLDDGRVVALEALARWFHPTLGLLSPMTFMDLAEDASLDVAVGDAVIESACAALGRVNRESPHLGRPSLAINLSIGQLSDRDLPGSLQRILSRHDLGFSSLVVEVTERATLARGARPGGVSPESSLLELRSLGAALSLDDFGTGYSSLTHVRRYPLAHVKVDRSFVAGMVDHPEDRAVVAAVIGLARALDLEVVAEGVETKEQLDLLRRLGCHQAQGYLLGRPMAEPELARWARDRAPVSRPVRAPAPARRR
jgi:diguanylate cyclase (GGDEF)-like protein/PAS domain S-box-containing protein